MLPGSGPPAVQQHAIAGDCTDAVLIANRPQTSHVSLREEPAGSSTSGRATADGCTLQTWRSEPAVLLLGTALSNLFSGRSQLVLQPAAYRSCHSSAAVRRPPQEAPAPGCRPLPPTHAPGHASDDEDPPAAFGLETSHFPASGFHTDDIKACRNVAKLAAFIDRHEPELRCYHVVAAIVHVAKLPRGCGGGGAGSGRRDGHHDGGSSGSPASGRPGDGSAADGNSVAPLLRRLAELLRQRNRWQHVRPREASALFQAFVWLWRSDASTLRAALAPAGAAGALSPGELPLLESLARRAAKEPFLRDADPQHVSQLMWALAELRWPHPDLLDACRNAALRNGFAVR